jgi:hypothetical protein
MWGVDVIRRRSGGADGPLLGVEALLEGVLLLGDLLLALLALLFEQPFALALALLKRNGRNNVVSLKTHKPIICDEDDENDACLVFFLDASFLLLLLALLFELGEAKLLADLDLLSLLLQIRLQLLPPILLCNACVISDHACSPTRAN